MEDDDCGRQFQVSLEGLLVVDDDDDPEPDSPSDASVVAGVGAGVGIDGISLSRKTL